MEGGVSRLGPEDFIGTASGRGGKERNMKGGEKFLSRRDYVETVYCTDDLGLETLPEPISVLGGTQTQIEMDYRLYSRRSKSWHPHHSSLSPPSLSAAYCIIPRASGILGYINVTV